MAQTTPAAADGSRAGDAQATPAAAANGPKVNKEGLVCHSEEIIGSRIPKRVCYTPEEAAQRQQEDRRNIEHMQQQNYTHSPG